MSDLQNVETVGTALLVSTQVMRERLSVMQELGQCGKNIVKIPILGILGQEYPPPRLKLLM